MKIARGCDIIDKNIEEDLTVFKTLRIICCVICALILAATVFIFIYLDVPWGIASLVVAAAFFGLMMLFKHKQEQQERKDNPPPTVGDFISGPVKAEEKAEEKDDDKE